MAMVGFPAQHINQGGSRAIPPRVGGQKVMIEYRWGTDSIMIGYRSRGRPPRRRGGPSRSDKGPLPKRRRTYYNATRLSSTKLPRRLHRTAEAAALTAVSRIASAQAYPTRAPAPPGTIGIPRPGSESPHRWRH